MKSCTQCGSAASDGALKCPACKAWLVAAAPPGAPAPAPASPPPTPAPAAAWSPPPAAGGYAPASAGANPGPAPAFGEAPAYGQAPAYAQESGYQSVAVADGDFFPRPAAAPNPAPTGSWQTPTGAWQTTGYSAQPAARNGRLSLRRLPNITWDRKRAMPFIAGGCAILVAAAGLFFFLGRGNGSHAPAPTAKTVAKPKPHPTAKQRAQANRVAQNDLRNALTAEKVVYVDNQSYVASPAAMRKIEPSLAWGTHVRVAVGDAASPGDRSIVCISETTRYGDTWALIDVAAGASTGAYYGRKPCPARITARGVPALASRGGW